MQLFAAAGNSTWRVFGLVVLVFAGSLGLFAILQFASGASQIYGIVDTPEGALFGPYVDHDHFAGLMEMLLPVAVLTIAGPHRRFSLEARVLCACAATLAFASLLLSGSRGGLLALAAETAIATAALRKWGARTRERRRLAMAGALTLLAGVMLFAYVDPGWVAKRLGSVVHVEGSWADWASWRKIITLDALRMWRDHPLLGVGLGNFETAYPRYQSLPSELWIDHAHNDYAEAVAETGLAGALLILLALGLFLRLAFRDWGSRYDLKPAAFGWAPPSAAAACWCTACWISTCTFPPMPPGL